MKNTIRRIIESMLVIAVSVLFLTENSAVCQAVRESTSLCVRTVVPSLFPFLAVSDYILLSGMNSFIGRFCEKIMRKLFKLPGEAAFIIIMSMTGGYPVGAKMISECVQNGTLSFRQAKRMLCFCVGGGPAFIVFTVGAGIIGSVRAGAVMLFSLSFSSVLMGILSSFFVESEENISRKENLPCPSPLTQCVDAAVRATVNICAWITVFSALESAFLVLVPEGNLREWISVFLEVTRGCAAAVKCFPLPVCTFALGWSGLAVHAQVMPYIRKVGMKYSHFVCARLLHASASAVISAKLFELFPCEVKASADLPEPMSGVFSVSASAAAAMLFLCALIILDLAPKKKV